MTKSTHKDLRLPSTYKVTTGAIIIPPRLDLKFRSVALLEEFIGEVKELLSLLPESDKNHTAQNWDDEGWCIETENKDAIKRAYTTYMLDGYWTAVASGMDWLKAKYEDSVDTTDIAEALEQLEDSVCKLHCLGDGNIYVSLD